MSDDFIETYLQTGTLEGFKGNIYQKILGPMADKSNSKMRPPGTYAPQEDGGSPTDSDETANTDPNVVCEKQQVGPGDTPSDGGYYQQQCMRYRVTVYDGDGSVWYSYIEFDYTDCIWVYNEYSAAGDSNCDDTTVDGKVPVISTNEDAILDIIDVLLKDNPTLLITDFCDELNKYIEMINFTPPDLVIQKLSDIDDIRNRYWVQHIQGATGTVINMDKFSVTLDLPIDPHTGKTYSATSLLNHIRLNLNSFMKDNSTQFSSYNLNESRLWSSSNYLGSIMRFDIRINNTLTQDGSLITSDQSNQHWRFSTIFTPKDWTHPVSGTREFGIVDHGNGKVTFYTQGVDRQASSAEQFFGQIFRMKNAFESADDLWTSVMVNIGKLSPNYLINEPIKARPNWSLVEKVMKGELPISTLGCD